MAEAASVLDGARYTGFVTVADAGLRGMITLRGDLASDAVAGAVKDAVGLGVPGQRRVHAHGDRAVAWMSPDELLVMVPYADASEVAGKLAQALAGAFATVANVSDARAVFTLSGAAADDALCKLCPVDFAQLGAGEIRRTRAAQVAVALWRSGEGEVTLVCFRSVAEYVFGLLRNAAAPGGELR
ncbi:sarcosine oxidase subunit gamma [Rhodobacteraceae bacterium 2376]|uniref:Sarcosine oxidase subunit gamma n=1 Tax=Rhabdonatronobacter sediminivivens TaxID=2743469 RepID=A0A7Z0HXE7_9RHOB|nr:sarcosine oxidase subunit gamma family protein [Rhabdonatronobacter sediminivivens]NYS24086.1 sarcosine oxidase subunit gamma [Rhabdonatronobacter sediminivivens]